MSQRTESRHTLTDTCTSISTIWYMSRGDWSKCLYSRTRDICTCNSPEEGGFIKGRRWHSWITQAERLPSHHFPFCFISTAPCTYTIWQYTRRIEPSYNDDNPICCWNQCEDQKCLQGGCNIKVVCKSGQTLCLLKMKDLLSLEKQSNMVYKITCSCGKLYISETKKRLMTRIKCNKWT